MNNATNEKFQGAKYDANATAAENAKRIRADVKEAIKAGKLPKGIKVAVRTSTYSMGASIRVAIEEFPGSILNPAHVFAFALNYGTGFAFPNFKRFTRQVEAAIDTLSAIVDQYQRTEHDAFADYSNANFYAFVDVKADTEPERARLLASDMFGDLKIARETGSSLETLESMIAGYDLSR